MGCPRWERATWAERLCGHQSASRILVIPKVRLSDLAVAIDFCGIGPAIAFLLWNDASRGTQSWAKADSSPALRVEVALWATLHNNRIELMSCSARQHAANPPRSPTQERPLLLGYHLNPDLSITNDELSNALTAHHSVFTRVATDICGQWMLSKSRITRCTYCNWIKGTGPPDGSATFSIQNMASSQAALAF
jgi:hypothetical protein